MSKTGLMVAVSLAVLVLIGTSAMAWSGFGRGNAGAVDAGATAYEKGQYHEQMEQIVETGSYADLEALREETGRPMAPWVQSQEDFDVWKARHEQMEAEYGEGPHMGAYGPRDGTGFRRGRGGCPMRDVD